MPTKFENKDEKSYIPVQIKNKSLGKLNGYTVYLDTDLYTELEKLESSDAGTMLNLFKKGMALRGLKHLLEFLTDGDNEKKIVLSKQVTSKTETKWIINYDDYKSKTAGRFFSLYRETGLDSANFYLNQYFPDDFPYDKARVTDKQLKAIDKDLPNVLMKLKEKTKNKKAILESTSNIIQELKQEKKELNNEINYLEKIKNESNIAVMLNAINQLEERLNSGKTYKETIGLNSWQNWFYQNNWMFGAYYLKPIEKQRVGFDNIPDFLFPTIDGFIDVLEIKLPTHEVIKEDDSHTGSFMWSPKSSEAIGQVVNYLNEIELNQLQLQKKIKENYGIDLSTIKPRAFILISNGSNYDSRKMEALRKLNYSLHGIEVLTYADLKRRAERMIKIFNDKITES